MSFLADLLRPYLTQLLIIGAIAGAGVLGFVTLKTHYTNVGYIQAMEAIAAQDKEAINAAAAARDRVRACRDTRGVWDVTQGVCRRQ
jgi:hypothetical protein